MQAFLIYLLQAGTSLGILYGVYCLFLRKETFYQLNRYVLLAILGVSAIVPLLPFSVLWPGSNLAGRMLSPGETFSLLLPPVTVGDTGSPDGKGAAGLSLLSLIFFLYLLVAGVLLVRLLVRILAALKPAFKGSHLPQGKHTLVLLGSGSEEPHSPFTFFRYIFLHPSQLRKNHIIDHERIHARQLHSIDHILAELYTVVFWFNPVSWWHKKEMLLNLEYLADQGTLRQGHERQAYQLDVLQASIGRQSYALANYFAQSIIKKRIEMMNTRQSPRRKSWKYLLLIPAITLTLAFSRYPEMDFRDETGQTSFTSSPGYDRANTERAQTEHLPASSEDIGEDQTRPVVKQVKFTPPRIIPLQEITEDDAPPSMEELMKDDDLLISDPAENRLSRYEVEIKASGDRKDSERPGGEVVDNKVYDFASIGKKPEYPGGERAFQEYVYKNFKYPAVARENNIQGMVIVQFTIEKDGSVTNIKAVRGQALGGGLAEEAVRVISGSEQWDPGEQNGRTVRVSYTMPINAKLKPSPTESS